MGASIKDQSIKEHKKKAGQQLPGLARSGREAQPRGLEVQNERVGGVQLCLDLFDQLLIQFLTHAQNQRCRLLIVRRGQCGGVDVDALVAQQRTDLAQRTRLIRVNQEQVGAGGAQVQAAVVDADDLLHVLQASQRASDGGGGAIGCDNLNLQDGAVADGLVLRPNPIRVVFHQRLHNH
ncbi:hypothetical protein RC30_08750 [Campylobacter jejuni]|nr:hypothetical protein RC30_08750 [Campylobacter jejuni]